MADKPEQKWLPRTPYLDVPEAGRCQVCGMEDGNRFKLGVGTATWNGYPVHDACEQWITTNPDGSKAKPKIGPPAKMPSGAVRARAYSPFSPVAFPQPAPDPDPAPHDVILHFPNLTHAEVKLATMSQTGGQPILVTGAQPGDSKLLFYRLPGIPKYLTLDGEKVRVAGGGPLDGGFTLVMLRQPLKASHDPGTIATPGSEPPREGVQASTADVAENVRRLNEMWSGG